MKITKRQLKRIIREEYQRVIQEARKPSRNAVTKKLVSIAEEISEENEWGDNVNIMVISDELLGGQDFETFHIMRSIKELGNKRELHREVQQVAYNLIKQDDPTHPILQDPNYQPLQIEKPKKSRIHPDIRRSRAAPGWRD